MASEKFKKSILLSITLIQWYLNKKGNHYPIFLAILDYCHHIFSMMSVLLTIIDKLPHSNYIIGLNVCRFVF